MYYNYEYAVATAISNDKNFKPIAVSDIFSRKRNKEIVLARQILMYYRCSVLKKSLAVSAARYDLDHSTCHYGIRKLVSYFKTYPEYKKLYNKFLGFIDVEFTGKIYLTYSKIETNAAELYSLSCSLDGSFESHEAAMIKFSEVESNLLELKKLIVEKWKEQ